MFRIKVLITSLITFFNLLNLYGQRVEHIDYYDLPPEYIQTNKIIQEEVYLYNISRKGKVDSTLFQAFNFKYDAQNNIIEQQRFDDKRNLKATYTYLYDNANRVVKEIDNYNYPRTRKFGLGDRILEFQYDGTGQHIYTYNYTNDTSTLKITKKEYNDKGLLVKAFVKLNKNEQLLRYLLIYDDDNRLIRLELFDDNGAEDFSYLYEYDLEKRIKTVYTKTKNGRHFEERLKYNNLDQLIQRTSNSKTDTPDKSDAEAENRIEKFIYNTDGTLNTKITYINEEVSSTYRHFYRK